MTAETNRDLANEAAAALLSAIKTQASRSSSPEQLRDLATAYATVKDAMPKGGRAQPSPARG